jgi:hypothetical protein
MTVAPLTAKEESLIRVCLEKGSPFNSISSESAQRLIATIDALRVEIARLKPRTRMLEFPVKPPTRPAA